jgi:cytoskeletal protein CcmA (bactofilin family)
MAALLSILILTGLLATVAVPFVPGILEILRPRDDRPLGLDRSYARDPFVFAHDFRAKFESLLATPSWVQSDRPSKDVRIASIFRIGNGVDDRRAVLASTLIETGTEVQLGECYARRSVTLGPSSRASAVLSEGTLRLLHGCSIERWTHSAVDTYADAGCDLGRAASSAGRLHLERGVRFQRLYGNPVSSYAAPSTTRPVLNPLVLTGEEGDIETNGDTEVSSGAVIHGSIRSRAAVRIGSGAQIYGNVIASAEIIVGAHAIIFGHVFSPAIIRLGANSRVGSSLTAKTVYGNRVILAAGVRVFGSIVADRGGFIE